MTKQKEDNLMEALRAVVDPEIGLEIVELGLIRTIAVDDEKNTAVITMILTTPFCPYGPAIVDQVRKIGNDLMSGGVTVEIGTELWEPTMMEEGAGGDWGLF